MSRNNRRITDLKWNSKKSLNSMKIKLERMSSQWEDMDFFLVAQFEQIIAKIDETIEEIEGIDAKSH